MATIPITYYYCLVNILVIIINNNILTDTVDRRHEQQEKQNYGGRGGSRHRGTLDRLSFVHHQRDQRDDGRNFSQRLRGPFLLRVVAVAITDERRTPQSDTGGTVFEVSVWTVTTCRDQTHVYCIVLRRLLATRVNTLWRRLHVVVQRSTMVDVVVTKAIRDQRIAAATTEFSVRNGGYYAKLEKRWYKRRRKTKTNPRGELNNEEKKKFDQSNNV